GDVVTLAVSGGTVYAGGTFYFVDDQVRPGAVAIDAATGQVTAWDPGLKVSKSGISAIVVDRNKVYLGGNFWSVGNQYRNNVVVVDAVTGQPGAWNPWMAYLGAFYQGVSTISISGSNLFLGGDFTSVGGAARNNLAAIDAATGKPTGWDPNTEGSVFTLAVAGGTVYVGGRFNGMGGQSRSNLAAVDAATGQVKAWNPDAAISPFTGVYALAAVGSTVYVGGTFYAIGGQYRNSLAAVDATTGQATAWDPKLEGSVSTLAVAGGTVYVGGPFNAVGGQSRNNLAAVDAATGQVKAWNPNSDGAVSALTVDGSTVYAGGPFTKVGGQTRNYLAALDAASGLPTAWNPNANNAVTALAVVNGTVYVGGTFTAVGGQTRDKLASVDAATGLVTAWNPSPSDSVVALTIYEGRVHAGGTFGSVGGKNVRGLAVFHKAAPVFNYIRGNIYEDADGDCVKDAGERGIRDRVVMARPGNYFGTTDSLGNYALAVDTGSYTVQQLIPPGYEAISRQVCPAPPAGHPVRFTSYGNAVAGKDFANQTQVYPALSVSVSSSGRRRCFANTTVVEYRNTGNGPAQGVKVYVKLPRYVVPVAANVPYRFDGDKNLVFDAGTLIPGARYVIYLTDSVVCNSPGIVGLTQCTKVWITPENPRPAAPGWDRSDIALKGACVGNGKVRLVLTNTGAGSMADSSTLRVYLDAQLALARRYQLAPGDSLVLQVPADGRTVRLEADQRPAHPRKKQGNVTLEACGTSAGGQVSLGFVNRFPQDDEEPEVDIQCLRIIDSFDPNDKAVSPAGVTDGHYTPTGSRLDYVIRFQNTGTDVAYKVVVTDTLSEHMDLATLQVGAASHPYRYTVSGKGRPVLTLTFNNIMLPDSNANEPKSHGFVKFSIKPKVDLPEKTRIENFADIFFDYNEPVRTNTVFNRIYDVPPVVAEALKRDGGVVCYQARATPWAGVARSVCRQDTVHLRAASPEFGQGSWVRISGGGTVPGTGNPVVVTGLAYGDNVFEWRVPANACSTDSLRARVTITRLKEPATPAILPVGTDSLACNGTGREYAWYLDGTPLGLSARTIRAAREGRYAVQVTDAAGCASDPSAPFAYVLTAIQPTAASRVSLYPNPTTGRVAVVLPTGLGPQVHIAVYDALGRLVASRRVQQTAGEHKEEFDLSACRPGVLLFKLQTQQGVVTRRIVRSSR
ncbi:MAG: PQQ-binding-like beta-propeller repeat protein, partial [Cytophagales bacterium]|nr:PQQ-binding-like beta-propeller repeat protein [Cytophagales bacterium]